MSRRSWSIATRLCHPTSAKVDKYSAMSTPIFQTATFEQPTSTTFGEYDYSRSGNPTRTVLEEQMAALDGADRSFAFGSGMAAISTLLRLVPSGGRIVTGNDIYGGTSRLLGKIAPRLGISVEHVDMCSVESVRAALVGVKTDLVLLETPTNPRLRITDLAGVAAAAREAGAICAVDNSVMAPVLQQPLAHGADIVMSSATKFIAGHSDTTGGILSVRGKELCEQVAFIQNAEGSALGPFECWLCLRGLKTMALRMERQQHNAWRLADFLERHPLVTRVNYPGLASHPGHELHMAQASGPGSILSFETGDVEASKAVVEATELFKVTVSFGSTNSLISLPCFMSHASIPPEVRAARGLPDDLVRISAGIEEIADLISDLGSALDLASGGGAQHSVRAAADAARAEETDKAALVARVKQLEAELAALKR
ncbi:Cys/Met metabolism PLP-dependent enzyme-domain-containing protein [Pavlovales sp. CCMP2436]|nr:Cys/Met metabolism PLP-dependent enzyme-domain-containing protein [Pavlovales sp. CCMP2436]